MIDYNIVPGRARSVVAPGVCGGGGEGQGLGLGDPSNMHLSAARRLRLPYVPLTPCHSRKDLIVTRLNKDFT